MNVKDRELKRNKVEMIRLFKAEQIYHNEEPVFWFDDEMKSEEIKDIRHILPYSYTDLSKGFRD